MTTTLGSKMNVTIPKDLHAQLKALAKSQGRQLGWVIEQAARSYLATQPLQRRALCDDATAPC